MSKTNEWCYVLAGILIGCFSILAYVVISTPDLLYLIDQPIIKVIRGSITPEKTWTFSYFTKFANTSTIVFLTAVSMFFLYFIQHNKVATYWIGITMLFIQGIGNFTIKLLIHRPRPDVEHLVQAHNSSFPSGHAMGSMLFYGMMFILIPELLNSKRLRFMIQLLLTIIILMVGCSRIYLGVHYPTDILGGYLLGLAWLLLSYPSFRKYDILQRRKGKSYYVSI